MPSTKPMVVVDMGVPELVASNSDAAKTSGRGDLARPRLAKGFRIRFDDARGQHVLLSPEAVLILNSTSAEIVQLCDGRRTIAEMLDELQSQYGEINAEEVRGFIEYLTARGGIRVDND